MLVDLPVLGVVDAASVVKGIVCLYYVDGAWRRALNIHIHG